MTRSAPAASTAPKQQALRGSQLKQLRDIFRRFDMDGDGSLTQLELAAVLRPLGLRPTGDEVHALLAGMDADGNGKVESISRSTYSGLCSYGASKYNIQNLVSHFHERGLYRSVFLSIMEGEESLPRFSPEIVAKKLSAEAIALLPQIILLHGTDDHSIPSSASATFADVLKQAGGKVKLQLYEGKTHTDVFVQDPLRGGKDQLVDDAVSVIHADDAIAREKDASTPIPERLVYEWQIKLARQISPFGTGFGSYMYLSCAAKLIFCFSFGSSIPLSVFEVDLPICILLRLYCNSGCTLHYRPNFWVWSRILNLASRTTEVKATGFIENEVSENRRNDGSFRLRPRRRQGSSSTDTEGSLPPDTQALHYRRCAATGSLTAEDGAAVAQQLAWPELEGGKLREEREAEWEGARSEERSGVVWGSRRSPFTGRRRPSPPPEQAVKDGRTNCDAGALTQVVAAALANYGVSGAGAPSPCPA